MRSGRTLNVRTDRGWKEYPAATWSISDGILYVSSEPHGLVHIYRDWKELSLR